MRLTKRYTRPPTAVFFLKCCLPHKCFRLRKVFSRMLAAGEFNVRVPGLDAWIRCFLIHSTFAGCEGRSGSSNSAFPKQLLTTNTVFEE